MMSGKHFSNVMCGNSSPNKCDNTECEGEVDRISQLPDDMMVHILSFLPLEKAAATSILSTRWLELWKYTPNLNFLSRTFLQPERIMLKYRNLVNSVIKSHKALSLKEFSISFTVVKSAQLEVTKWLEYAFSRRVEYLALNFQVPYEEDAPVLEEILRQSSIPSCDFKSLEDLILAYFKVGGEAIQLLLRHCPLLERLTIRAVNLTSDVEVVGKKLKHLDIRSRRSKNSIKISCAPNLTWFRIDHVSRRVYLEDVPKVVRMDFFCRFSDTLHDFANAAAHLETLTITLHFPESMEFSVPKMPKLKKLILYYREVYKDVLLPITCLIRASPRLQEFELDIDYLRIIKGIFEVPKAGRFPHHHLRVFNFVGYFSGAPDHMELVRYVVDNCAALEKIFIATQLPPTLVIYGAINAEQRAAWLKDRQSTQRVLAQKLPHHIQLHVT